MSLVTRKQADAPLEVGKRDKWVRLQQLTESKGATKYPVESWTTLADVWAWKSDLRGDERMQSDQTTAHVDTLWRFPYRADMDPDLLDVPKIRRLLYKGRTYEIVAATLIGRQEGVEVETLAKPG